MPSADQVPVKSSHSTMRWYEWVVLIARSTGEVQCYAGHTPGEEGMLRADRRFVVSHVGSMVRPPAMIPYLQKAQAGEPYDKAAFESCLTESVIEAVRLQAETGIDVVSDGEYGKSGTWAFYVHRRLGGIEWRP